MPPWIKSAVAELTFVGAAGTVTGSKHLLTAGGRHLLVDCGLFQGTHAVEALNAVPLPVRPSAIDAVVVTHGHLDHVGYLPRLVRDGFRGRIHTTPATRAVMQIVLDDSANLQQHLARRGMAHHPYVPPAYYDPDDVVRTMELVDTTELHTPFTVCGLEAQYANAAHIIGSAFLRLTVDGRTIVFSGDLGRYGRPLLYDPDAIGQADTIVCESTYGDRVHPPDAVAELHEILSAALPAGGAIVIPAFAVERSQEMLYAIAEIQRRDPSFAKVPVFLDSPMAAAVDAVFEDFPGAHRPIAGDNPRNPFGIANLAVTKETEASKALNGRAGTHIIIAASGMASGGRILHHLHNRLSDPRATILFVGYQGAGTIGNALVHGAKSARIYGGVVPVRAAIRQAHGFSAHADRNELERWLRTCAGSPRFYAVHGEPESAQSLCDLAQHDLHWQASVAKRGVTVAI